MKTDTFVFNHFKEYARFCLDHHFEILSQEYISKIKELNGQPLHVLSHLSEEESRDYLKDRLKTFLKSAADNSSFNEIELVIKNWKIGNLPGKIDKYSIKPSDILLGFAARKNVLLHFIPQFTTDINNIISIIRELNLFNLLLEEKIFKTYLDVQQELINSKNEELNHLNYQLQGEVYERIKVEEKLRIEKDFSEAVINNSIDGIFAFDRELRITSWNKKLEELNGLSKERVLGKNIFDLFPAYNNTEEGESLKRVLQGETVLLSDKPYEHHRGYYEASFVPLLNNKNEISGGIAIIHDITLSKKAEEKLKSRENLLKEAQEIAHLGSWEWVLRSNKVFWSDHLFRIFGYESSFQM
jgi:PAS domain S-box-containing protein